VHPPQTITKKEMELLIALQGGKRARELKTVKELDTGKIVKIDRCNLHGYLISLELRGFVRRELSEIENDRTHQKGGPKDATVWYINLDSFHIIMQELNRLRGIKPVTHEDFWKEVETANQETEWERHYLARQEHYRKLEHERDVQDNLSKAIEESHVSLMQHIKESEKFYEDLV
jgi:hypothetical protein